MSVKKMIAGAVLLAALALGLAAVRWKPEQWKDVFVMRFHEGEVTADVTLKPGEDVRGFAREIQEKGLVASSRNLLYWLSKDGTDRKLKTGTYGLSSGPSWKVAGQLKTASPKYQTAKIIPGSLPFAPLTIGTLDEQKAALSDLNNFPEKLRAFLPEPAEYRAAFLLPETYSMVDVTPGELVRQASSAWSAKFCGRLKSPEQAKRAAVIASLIQREAQIDSEYPIIAGVIENRLARKMPLQIDATIVYAWYLQKGEKLKRVLYKHLEVDSPYNTYKNAGLPPYPICVPSAAAWDGALSPQEHGYLYYVADGNGGHKFAKTSKEHSKNVNDYRKKK